jgi:hypothetical protein
VVAHGAAKNPTQRRKGAKIFFSKTYLCALAPRVLSAIVRDFASALKPIQKSARPLSTLTAPA